MWTLMFRIGREQSSLLPRDCSRPSKFYWENVMSANLAEIESRLWSTEERIAENVARILEDTV